MIVVERGVLLRVTIVVSMRSCSSAKLVKSGTVFSTAVDTGPAMKRDVSISTNGDTACPAPDSRLRPGGLHRRGLRGAGQPAAGADRRRGAGRPAHDHDRCGQLAGRRRRRPGTGPDAALPEARRALRDRSDRRPDPYRAPGRAPVRAG